jgi:hypothetical protein
MSIPILTKLQTDNLPHLHGTISEPESPDTAKMAASLVKNDFVLIRVIKTTLYLNNKGTRAIRQSYIRK